MTTTTKPTAIRTGPRTWVCQGQGCGVTLYGKKQVEAHVCPPRRVAAPITVPDFVPCPTIYPERRIWDVSQPDPSGPPARIEHNVPCGGVLRECEICGAVRFCGREGHCLDGNTPGHVVRRRFNIEDLYGDGIIGWTQGERWNGWACPRFELSEALQIVAINRDDADDPTRCLAWYDDQADAVFMQQISAFGPDGKPSEFETDRYDGELIDTPDGPKKVYPIGAWAWCWDASVVAPPVAIMLTCPHCNASMTRIEEAVDRSAICESCGEAFNISVDDLREAQHRLLVALGEA